MQMELLKVESVSIPPYRLGLFLHGDNKRSDNTRKDWVSIPPYRLGLFLREIVKENGAFILRLVSIPPYRLGHLDFGFTISEFGIKRHNRSFALAFSFHSKIVIRK